MKNFLVLLMLFAFSTGLFSEQNPKKIDTDEKIRLGYFSCPPHIFLENNASHPQGAAVEYWGKIIAPRMGLELEWIGPLSFARLIYSLQNGTLDGAVILGKNAEREQFVYFPESELYEARSSILVLDDSEIRKIRSIEDVIPLKIGYVEKQIITPFMSDPRISWDMLGQEDWIVANFRRLLMKRVDAVYFVETFVAEYNLRRESLSDKIRIVPLPEPPTRMYSVFSKKTKNGKDLANRFDAIQKTEKNADTYMKFIDIYTK